MKRRHFLQSTMLTAFVPHVLKGKDSKEKNTFEAASLLEERMLEFMNDRGIPGGSVAFLKDGELRYEKGFGWRDREHKQPVKPETLFRLASVSKPITAVGVLRLLDLKSLRLEDPVMKYLDCSDPVDARWKEITIAHLLHHAGGWDRDRSGDPMFQTLQMKKDLELERPPTFSEIISWVAQQPLDFDPGTRMAYSNFGYCLLGRVIERVTGQSYESWIKQEILAPLGLTSMKIGRSLLSERDPDESKYYVKTERTVQSVFSKEMTSVPDGGFHLESMDSHGGWIGNAREVAAFAAQIVGKHALLSQESRLWMFSQPSFKQEKVPRYYAAGWSVVRTSQEGMNVFHQGSLPGTLSWMVHRHDGWAWALLFNLRSENNAKPDSRIDQSMHEVLKEVS